MLLRGFAAHKLQIMVLDCAVWTKHSLHIVLKRGCVWLTCFCDWRVWTSCVPPLSSVLPPPPSKFHCFNMCVCVCVCAGYTLSLPIRGSSYQWAFKVVIQTLKRVSTVDLLLQFITGMENCKSRSTMCVCVCVMPPHLLFLCSLPLHPNCICILCVWVCLCVCIFVCV